MTIILYLNYIYEPPPLKKYLTFSVSEDCPDKVGLTIYVVLEGYHLSLLFYAHRHH